MSLPFSPANTNAVGPIRPARAEDLAFVRSSWLQSYASSDWALLSTPKDDAHTIECAACRRRSLKSIRIGCVTKHKAGEEYWAGQRQLIERLIARSNVSVYEADPGMVDGWICRDWIRPVCHYVYVRNSARGQGIARALAADLAEQPTHYTHRSRGVQGSRVPRGWVFDVYELVA